MAFCKSEKPNSNPPAARLQGRPPRCEWFRVKFRSEETLSVSAKDFGLTGKRERSCEHKKDGEWRPLTKLEKQRREEAQEKEASENEGPKWRVRRHQRYVDGEWVDVKEEDGSNKEDGKDKGKSAASQPQPLKPYPSRPTKTVPPPPPAQKPKPAPQLPAPPKPAPQLPAPQTKRANQSGQGSNAPTTPNPAPSNKPATPNNAGSSKGSKDDDTSYEPWFY
ncbi:hypothetical protein JW721_02865 [Candidatus Micrarchaeota archaeon]|nr:hypothetical protein [Candidatus Micrarchaeota archaeon]